MKHINIKITGLVQGVSFRYYAMERAKELGISGFAQNMPDGSLIIEAEGSADDLEEFVKWCYHGSDLAKVESVEISPGELKKFDKFSIRY